MRDLALPALNPGLAAAPREGSARLRIALIAPPWYSIPPVGYGGIERVVHLLDRVLRDRGHDVTLFARSDSAPGPRLVGLAPPEWEPDLGGRHRYLREFTYLARVHQHLSSHTFDVIHDHSEHTGMLAWQVSAEATPIVATVHGSIDEPQRTQLAEVDHRVGLVAISRSQREQAPSVRWSGVVHNAVDLDELQVATTKHDYVLQLARICPDKGQHLAIAAAREAGVRLVLAGKVEGTPDGIAYFEKHVEPHIGSRVKWLPDVGGRERASLIAHARAMLFPLQWEEPFGLAMVEAMVSGTPVLAFSRGAAPELVEEGVTGFLSDDLEGLLLSIQRVGQIDTERCAGSARSRFSAERMASGYEAVYRAALSAPSPAAAAPARVPELAINVARPLRG